MKKLTRDRVVPIISARVSWLNFPMIGSTVASFDRMQTEGSLEIGEYVVRIFTGIVFGDDAVRFDRRGGVARVADVDTDAMRSFRERALRVTVTKRALADDVAVDRRMQKRRVDRCGSGRVDHSGQRAIAHLDQINGVFGTVTVGSNDDRDRLTDIAHTIDRNRPALERRLHADHQT